MIPITTIIKLLIIENLLLSLLFGFILLLLSVDFIVIYIIKVILLQTLNSSSNHGYIITTWIWSICVISTLITTCIISTITNLLIEL